MKWHFRGNLATKQPLIVLCVGIVFCPVHNTVTRRPQRKQLRPLFPRLSYICNQFCSRSSLLSNTVRLFPSVPRASDADSTVICLQGVCEEAVSLGEDENNASHACLVGELDREMNNLSKTNKQSVRRQGLH